jgi:hypothetical protein
MNKESEILEKLEKIIELLTPKKGNWGAWDNVEKSEPEIDIQDMRQKDKKSGDPLKD